MNPRNSLASRVPIAVRSIIRNAGIAVLALLLAGHCVRAATPSRTSGEAPPAIPNGPGLPKSDPKLESLVQEVFAALGNKNYDLAISRSTAALQMTNDKNAAGFIYHLRAHAYIGKRDLTNAMNDANKAINLFPRFAGGYMERGIAHTKRREYDKAISDFDTVLRLNPYSINAYYNRGYTFGNRGDHARAIRDYSEAIRRSPRFPRAYINRGVDYELMGNSDKAIADYNEAIRQDPSDSDAYFNRGDLYFEKGNYKQAASDLAIAFKKAPTGKEVLNGVAWLKATCPQASLRNGKEALRLSLKACELTNWQNSDCIDTLAAAYAEIGAFDQAVKYQTQALNMKDIRVETRKEKEERRRLYQEHKAYRSEPRKFGPQKQTTVTDT